MIDIEELLKYSSDLKILYIEDNQSFAQDTVEIFNNFFSLVDLADNGKNAIDKYLEYFQVNQKYYDIVITDIFMPHMNGLELTKEIYKHNNRQPIIVISAHDESQYLLEFVNIGIEHFIVKPFDLEEIVEVLYNTTKRINPITSIQKLVNQFTWDKKNLILFYDDKSIELTKKEIQIVQILIDNGDTISKIDDILNAVWKNSMGKGSVNTLNPIISRLRKKLPQELIKSVYGVGYKLYHNHEEY